MAVTRPPAEPVHQPRFTRDAAGGTDAAGLKPKVDAELLLVRAATC
jgi:hypothetical protein